MVGDFGGGGMLLAFGMLAAILRARDKLRAHQLLAAQGIGQGRRPDPLPEEKTKPGRGMAPARSDCWSQGRFT